MGHEFVILNGGARKSNVSFNIHPPIDQGEYNRVAKHHKRKVLQTIIPVMILHNRSEDLCKLTGLSPEQIKEDEEFQKMFATGELTVLIDSSIPYVDPPGYYPVRGEEIVA